MPRFAQLIALSLALLLAGAPAVIAEMAETIEDDCADECAGEQGEESCPEEGCSDCSIICSSCARSHVVAPSGAVRFLPWRTEYVWLRAEGPHRLPAGPPPRGVFHPPRAG